jgi:hypothetical protein
VIVANPGEINRVSDRDGYRARNKISAPLPDVHGRRRPTSQRWQEDQKEERQAKIHFEGLAAEQIRGGG